MRAITILCFLLIMSACAIAQSGWLPQRTGISGDLVAVFFTSSDKGWIAGDGGFLAQTTDEGTNWKPYQLNTT